MVMLLCVAECFLSGTHYIIIITVKNMHDLRLWWPDNYTLFLHFLQIMHRSIQLKYKLHITKNCLISAGLTMLLLKMFHEMKIPSKVVCLECNFCMSLYFLYLHWPQVTHKSDSSDHADEYWCSNLYFINIPKSNYLTSCIFMHILFF